MSKPLSGYFKGTTGYTHFFSLIMQEISCDDIISIRVQQLDLNEHPIKKYSDSTIKLIKSKIKSRSATKNEYKKLSQFIRLSKRRALGVKNFWRQEKYRIKNNLQTTRLWTKKQGDDILSNKIPEFNNKKIQGHHTYSVVKYPHLANYGEVIYPVTQNEHLNGWHGGNFKTSLPGRPIIIIKDF